jgi:hypothetical protein
MGKRYREISMTLSVLDEISDIFIPLPLLSDALAAV